MKGAQTLKHYVGRQVQIGKVEPSFLGTKVAYFVDASEVEEIKIVFC